MRVYGRIEDAYTEELLPGAIVTLRVGDTELIEHTPSRDGQFGYEIPDETVPIDEDILTCVVEKKGYRTQTSTHRILDDIEIAVQLVPFLVNWRRIFIIAAIVLGALLLAALLYFGYPIVFPPKEPGVTLFQVEPTTIRIGGEVAFKWETEDADNVVLKWRSVDTDKILSGEDPVEPMGERTEAPTETRNYRLFILDDDGNPLPIKDPEGNMVNHVEQRVTVKPPPPVIAKFTADPMEIHLWDSAVLEWQTAETETVYILSDPTDKSMRVETKTIHRERAVINEDYPGTETEAPEEKKRELNGVIEVFPMETTTFTLVAVNAHGEQREQTVKVTVLEDPEIISFTAGAYTVDQGDSVILRWNTRNADQVFLNGERTGPRYSKEVYPDGSNPYVLTARNKIGDRHSTINITVRCDDVAKTPLPPKPPRIHRFHITSPVIAPGETTVLSWATDHGEKVYLTSQPVGIHTPPSDTVPATGRNAVDADVATDDALAETRGIFPEEKDELNMHGIELKENIESIAGKPLETGRIYRVKPVDSIEVSPTVSTYYELRVVNSLKTVTWTRTVVVQPRTCTIILYELENFRGESMRFTTGAAEIGKLNNLVSSIRIIGDCGVRVYSAPNFQATHQEFQKSIPRLRGTWIGNNTVSSFKIIGKKGVEQ